MSVSRGLTAAGLAAAAALVVAATWFTPAGKPAGAHLSQSACQDCHVARDPADLAGARKLLATQEVLCGRCHAAAIKVSHPSGFAPREKMAEAFPVDWKGELTCSTCHAVHGDNQGLLRGERRGRDLCLACHDAKFFAGMRDKGESLVMSGHLNAGVELNGGTLDPYSLQCLSCHGAKGESPAVSINQRNVLRHNSGRANHPIGMRYADAERAGGYRPAATVSRLLLLPNGRVGCVSCHQGFSKDHGKLTAPRAGSKICYQCHDI